MIRTVQIRDEDNVRAGLLTFRKELPNAAERSIFDMLAETSRSLQEYPPELPNQKYKRTFRFKNSWKAARLGSMTMMLFNDATARGRIYPSYVVGDEEGHGQARIHKGRWKTARGEVDRRISRVEKEIDRKLQVISNQTGLAT